MPYPILTLPYPFAKRLRQLLDPFELEELQKAAGSYVRNELKPIVKTRKVLAPATMKMSSFRRLSKHFQSLVASTSEKLEIVHDDFDELFSFKPALLYGYVKAQHSKFCILLSYKVNANRYDWIIHMMQKFVDPRFDVEVNGDLKVTLRVQLINNFSVYHDVHYYYKK